MTSDTPGPGTPGGPPTEPEGAPEGGWPVELTPPSEPAAPAPDAPTQPIASPTPAQPAPSAGTWGAPPAGTWGAPPAQPSASEAPGAPAEPAAPAGPAAPATPASSGTWGATPTAGTWSGAPGGAAPGPVPQTPPVPQGQGTWGAATPPPSGGGWGGATPPPSGGGWGAPQAPAPGQPGGAWGGQPQPGGWTPGPGAPGGPPGAWNPAPASSSGNGCLKACLIVGVILVIVAIVGFIGLFLFARSVLDDFGINPDGTFQECAYLSDAELDAAIGGDGTVAPLSGFIGEIAAEALDERILPDADDCWIIADAPGLNLAGRVAVSDDPAAAAAFQETRRRGAGSYTGPDVPGVGDEAFCTGVGAGGLGTGVLVRSGNRLVFVSLLDQSISPDYRFEDEGVMYSPATCELAARVARAVLE